MLVNIVLMVCELKTATTLNNLIQGWTFSKNPTKFGRQRVKICLLWDSISFNTFIFMGDPEMFSCGKFYKSA